MSIDGSATRLHSLSEFRNAFAVVALTIGTLTICI